MTPEIDRQLVSSPVGDTVETTHAVVSRDMVRGPDGLWRYAGSDVVVPGAVDVTLDQQVDALHVSRRDGAPHSVHVPVALVDEDPDRLGWVREVGRLLRGDDPADSVYTVSRELWAEHAGNPIDVDAPELGEPSLQRAAAIAERDLRFARWSLERQTERRARTLAIVSRLGMTRREAAALLDVTPGRVQQLVADDLPAATRLDIEELLDDMRSVLRKLDRKPVPADTIILPARRGPEFLEEMVELGLLVRHGDRVALTEVGEKAELHLHPQQRKRKDSA